MALSLLSAGLALSASRFLVVKAQSSTVNCDSTTVDFTWTTNSKGQGPCLVAAYLLVPCEGPVAAQIIDLNPEFMPTYGGPTNATFACGCNTVMYSLLQACTACQPRGYGGFLSWAKYIENCTNPVLFSYPKPIPPGTAIPAWAFQDVIRQINFNISEAKLTGDMPESTASPTSTAGTLSAPLGTTATSSSSSSDASTAGASSDGQGKSSNVGAIVGGVVGGVLGFLLLGLAVHMLLRQRKQHRQTEAQASQCPTSTVTDVDGPSEKPMAIMSVPSMIYDPDDPRTFAAATDPSPFGTGAAFPTPSVPPGSIPGHMHGFSAFQSYTAPGYNGSEHGDGYAGSVTYRGTPEV